MSARERSAVSAVLNIRSSSDSRLTPSPRQQRLGRIVLAPLRTPSRWFSQQGEGLSQINPHLTREAMRGEGGRGVCAYSRNTKGESRQKPNLKVTANCEPPHQPHQYVQYLLFIRLPNSPARSRPATHRDPHAWLIGFSALAVEIKQ